MKKAILVWSVTILALGGCASVTLKPVDFSWSYESVLTTDDNGFARGEPKTIYFDAGELFRAELKQKDAVVAGKTVRIIRNDAGYYFVTAPGFKNVYIFDNGEGKLTLRKKVLIAEEGMEKPFFNRRDEGIQLVANGQVYILNKKGIVGGKK